MNKTINLILSFAHIPKHLREIIFFDLVKKVEKLLEMENIPISISHLRIYYCPSKNRIEKNYCVDSEDSFYLEDNFFVRQGELHLFDATKQNELEMFFEMLKQIKEQQENTPKILDIKGVQVSLYRNGRIDINPTKLLEEVSLEAKKQSEALFGPKI